MTPILCRSARQAEPQKCKTTIARADLSGIDGDNHVHLFHLNPAAQQFILIPQSIKILNVSGGFISFDTIIGSGTVAVTG